MRSVAELRDILFKLHAEARDQGEHHVAYHALAGALHAAESLADPEACSRIERIAREHGEWINAHSPAHALSSKSAAARGHESIFTQLSVMANSARLRMKMDAERAAFRKSQGRPKAPLREPKMKPKR